MEINPKVCYNIRMGLFSKEKTAKFMRSLRKYLASFTLLAVACAVIAVIMTGIVPWFYVLIVTALASGGLWVIVRPLYREKISRRKAVGLSLVSIAISVASLWTMYFGLTFTSFLEAIQVEKTSTETYSIVAKREPKMRLATAKTTGLVLTDPYYKESKKELSRHVKAKTKDQPTVQTAMDELDQKKIDTTALNSANLQVAKELSDTFDDTYEIIGTFTIKIKVSTKSSDVKADKPFVVYISGIDTYGEVSTVSRSDVNMLAVIDPTTKRILLVNTPRDYYVQLHGTTGSKDKLTHAGLYGIDMSRQTLEDLYGVEISYYLRVNFSSLVTIVDALGGVDVYSDHQFKSFNVGSNHLNGRRALEFSRERYSFQDGDRQRGRNQQRVIEAIISKLSNPSVLIKYSSIMSAAEDALQTNIPPAFISKLINQQLASPKNWTSRSISVDGMGSTGPTYSMGAQQLYIMIPDEASVAKARHDIKAIIQD